MTRTVRTFLASACALLASMAVCPRHAAAQLNDAGADSAATDAATSSDAAPDDGGADSAASSSSGTPLACDGSLCDTTNDSMCSASRHPRAHGAGTDVSALVVVLGIAAVAVRRRRAQRVPA